MLPLLEELDLEAFQSMLRNKKYFPPLLVLKWTGGHKSMLILILLWGGSAVTNAKDIDNGKWKKITQLTGVFSQPGIIVPSIYVFFDPNCPATAKLFRRNDNDWSFADSAVVWIPVYYMSNDSLGKASTMLRAKKFSMIKANFLSYDFNRRAGATDSVLPSLDERQKIDKAKEVWMDLTTTPATPMIIYKDRSGAAHVHLGYSSPEELERIVSDAPNSRLKEYK
jgi:hypothetical protein